MFTRAFWKRTAERVASTAAQAFIYAMGAAQVVTPIQSIRWPFVLGSTATLAVLTFAKCLAARGVGNPEDPSLIK